MLDQVFEYRDLFVLAALVVLEGLLSIDNAIVLALLVTPLPRRLRGRALSYGLVGALIFRTIAVFMAGLLLRWRLPRLLGGLYLIYIGVKNLLFSEVDSTDAEGSASAANGTDAVTPLQFWRTVLIIELTDLAFAVDSIVAAIAMVSGGNAYPPARIHPKLWLVVIGGIMGAAIIRYAANFLSGLIERFPRLKSTAYLLVLLIGVKLILDYALNGNSKRPAIDFQDPSGVAFWVFWLLAALCLARGFRASQTGQQSNDSCECG